MTKRRPEGGEGEKNGTSRRGLLQKAAYTAPTLMVLGVAAHSRRADAQKPPLPSVPDDGGADAAPAEDEILLEDIERNAG